MGSKVWVSFSWITFHALHEEIAKYCCIASPFCNIFHLVHDEVHNEANTCASCCTKLWRAKHSPELALRSTDFHTLESRIFPVMYILLWRWILLNRVSKSKQAQPISQERKYIWVVFFPIILFKNGISVNNFRKYIPPLFSGLEVLSSTSDLSDKAKLFAENFSKNSNLDDSGVSLPVFPSGTNLKLQNISITPK